MKSLGHFAYQVHRYVGLGTLLVLAATGLTGSVLIYKTNLLEAAYPELMRVDRGQERLTPNQALAKVQQAYPLESVRYIFPPIADEQTIAFEMSTGRLVVYVNPYSGEIVGSRDPTRGFLGWTRRIHTSFAAGKPGESLLTASGLGLVVVAASGSFIALRRGWSLVGKTRRQKAGRNRGLQSLHAVAGLWLTPVLMVAAMTGLALLHGPLLSRWVTPTQGVSLPLQGSGMVSTQENSRSLDLDQIVASAEALSGGSRVLRVTLPQNNQSAVTVRLRGAGELHPNGMTFLTFDGGSGELVSRVDAQQSSSLAIRLLNVRFPLHIGSYAGGVSQLIHFAGGIGLVLLSLSGGWIWIRRYFLRQQAPAKEKPHVQKEN